MAIVIDLDVVMAQRKMGVKELAEKIDITMANLSILKNNKAKAVRFTTLDALCRELSCQPGDILKYVPDEEKDSDEEK
jgi:putative transcriptional regulator